MIPDADAPTFMYDAFHYKLTGKERDSGLLPSFRIRVSMICAKGREKRYVDATGDRAQVSVSCLTAAA